MTFFLPDTKEVPVVYPDAPDVPQSSMWEGFGAAISKAQIENNANFYRQRTKSAIRDDLAVDAAERVGLDAVIDYASREGPGFDHIRGAPGSIEDLFSEYGREATDWAISAAREQAANEPEAWADLDISDEAIDAEMARRMQVDYEAAVNTLAGMPDGHGVTTLIGGMVGISVDVKNLPFMLMGGTGGILRVAGREALINMAAEMAFMPDQFIQADLLDIPDPNVPQQLAMAAGFGAAFGGTMAALGRGLEWARFRDESHDVGRLLADMELSQVQKAELETRIEQVFETSTRDPVMEAQRIVEDMRGPDLEMDEIPARPLDEGDAPRTPEEDYEDAVADLDRRIIEANPAMGRKYPLASEIIARGGIQYRRFNAETQSWELTKAAQELVSMGVTPRTHPFLWRKGGMSDLDNISVSDFDIVDGGSLRDVIEWDRSSGYFDNNAMTRALGEELSSGQKTPLDADIAELMRMRDTLDPDDFRLPEGPRGGEPRMSDGPLEIKPDEYRAQFGDEADARIRDDVHNWLAQRGYDELLTQREYGQLMADMRRQGGSVDDFMDRVWDDVVAREEARPKLTEVDDVEVEIPRARDVEGGQGALEPGGRGADGQDARAGGPGERGARAGDDPQPLYEATGAGQQGVIPGVEPITPRQRLEAAQAAPMRGGEAPADSGLFDLGARDQRDLFSDPTSKQARAVHDGVAADLRAKIEKNGDFEIDLGDGRGVRQASEVVEELDAMQDFADVMQLCGRNS